MAKTANSIPDFMEERSTTPDQLKALRHAVSELRDLELTKADLKDRLTSTNISINKHTRETLPDLFQSAGLTSLTLEADPISNIPEYIVKLDTEITANIAAGWSPDEKEAAFDWLTANGAADLIKATVTVTFDKKEVKKAEALRKELEKRKFDVEIEMKVNHMSLGAWLRERFAQKKVPKGISAIGGYIGPIVKLAAKRK
jgi:hypothetical protein